MSVRAIDVAEVRRIGERTPREGDVWSDDCPFDGDIIAVTSYLRTCAATGDQDPFGHYLVCRITDGRAIGGAGFKGRPVHGSVEIGYGLVPSARGQGLATAAVQALLLAAAARLDVVRVRASTTRDNVASQWTLSAAHFVGTGADTNLVHYEIVLIPADSAEVIRRPS